MIDIKDIESLNNRIEKLNVERTKTITRKELLQTQLEEKLAEYSEKYGVSLKGGSYEDTGKKVKAEIDKISSVIDEEYNFKLKLVQALEAGNYDEANSLLGIKEEVEEELSGAEEIAATVPSPKAGETSIDLEEKKEGNIPSMTMEDLESITEDDKPDGIEEEDDEISLSGMKIGGLVVEDSEDDASGDDLEESLTKESGKRNSGAKDFMSAIGDSSVKDAFKGLEVEDEDGEEEDDFGFGDIGSFNK